ncbi:hypothetical protein AB0B31_12630 [Catellatospora citrea]|uniref:hypothetical protein n=1 Tax=Catellatospora citrea TaxID=53366 RepID=UPI0033DF4526
MGAWANYVCVRDGEHTVLSNKLGAYELLEISAMGPGITRRYLERWEHEFGQDDWLSDALTDGGLLVDWDRSVLIAFTVHRSPQVRAAWLENAAHTWPGWQVRWAYDGNGDLARHAGADVTAVRAEFDGSDLLYGVERPWTSPDPTWLVTIADTAAYALTPLAFRPWEAGPGMLAQLRAADRVTSCDFVPRAGLHLDPATRTAGLWTTIDPLDGLAERWPARWPGWTLQLWDDRHAEQSARCTTGVTVPDADPGECRRLLARSVVQAWAVFVAEDVDVNLADVHPEPEIREHLIEPPSWYSVMRHTAVGRADLSAVHRMLTGEDLAHPVHRRRR